MFENMTYEYLLSSALSRVSNTLDKREASIIYDALAPCCAELAQFYIELDRILNLTFADTATGIYLDKRCAEKNVVRKPATKAIVKGEFTPITINVMGQRFNNGDFNYLVTNKISDGIYYLTCETPGAEGNAVSGQLIPLNHIAGLETATITEIITHGADAEEDEELRKRYFEVITNQAFGGNEADYKSKTIKIDGVGGAKITPTWDGGGTVKVTIITSGYTVPNTDLITRVQNILDNTAPIGHIVTVDGVNATNIDIGCDITYETGWSWEATSNSIKQVIDDYLISIAKAWDQSEYLTVRVSGIEEKILSCVGVKDIQNTTINGARSNVRLGTFLIPVRGLINGS